MCSTVPKGPLVYVTAEDTGSPMPRAHEVDVVRGLVPRPTAPAGDKPPHYEISPPVAAEAGGTRPKTHLAPAAPRHRAAPGLWMFPLILAVLALLLLVFVAPVVRADSPVDEIAGQLACQCGCGLTALACGGAMQCDVGDQMVALISQKVKNGETKDQVLSYFVTQYGEKVLAAPTKKGFNLTAWVTPFLAVGAGGTVVYFVLREWIGNRRTRQESETPAGVDLGSYGEPLDRELEQFG